MVTSPEPLSDADRQRENGYTDKALNEHLYDADPACKHVLDPDCWSGIRYLNCAGWFCH